MPHGGSTLHLPVPAGLNLARAVCSYGYFMLAPNAWDGRTRRLSRVLHDESAPPVNVQVTRVKHERGARLRITCDRSLSRGGASLVRRQVARMLRLDEDFTCWRRLHPKAKRARFDCLFRSPSLFEDIVKTITGCNVTWPNTMRMNRLLCDKVGRGAFPSPMQLARLRPSDLKRRCKVGYRAERIIRLARQVESGELDLATFEDRAISTDDLFEQLRSLHGIGPYAAANLCQLLGRYDRLAIDTETYRHFRQVHGVPTPKDAAGLRRLHRRIEAHYEPYAPYQFLAYWFELWDDYQARVGDARQWSADEHGPSFTASNLERDAATRRKG